MTDIDAVVSELRASLNSALGKISNIHAKRVYRIDADHREERVAWDARRARDADRIRELEVLNKQQAEWLRAEWGGPDRIVGEFATNRERAEKAEARVKELEVQLREVTDLTGTLSPEVMARLSEVQGFVRVGEQFVVSRGALEREEQAALIKRLQDEKAGLEADLLHERNRFNCVAIEQKNAVAAGVADRIVTSPEFREFVREIMDDSPSGPISDKAADLLVLLDREVKR